MQESQEIHVGLHAIVQLQGLVGLLLAKNSIVAKQSLIHSIDLTTENQNFLSV